MTHNRYTMVTSQDINNLFPKAKIWVEVIEEGLTVKLAESMYTSAVIEALNFQTGVIKAYYTDGKISEEEVISLINKLGALIPHIQYL